MGLSKGQLEGLGSPSRAAEQPGAAGPRPARTVYYGKARRFLARAVEMIQALPIPAKGRLVRASLRPDSSKRSVRTDGLNRTQDIAGIPDPAGAGLVTQDEAQLLIGGIVCGDRVIDWRAKPSFGYRAVHVVTKLDGRWVEIQVRTQLQKDGAQVVENLASVWVCQLWWGQPGRRVA